MKSGKAVGHDDIHVEVWKCLREVAAQFLTRTFNKIFNKRNVVMPIFKKGDMQS